MFSVWPDEFMALACTGFSWAVEPWSCWQQIFQCLRGLLIVPYLLGVMSTADAAALRNKAVLVHIHKCQLTHAHKSCCIWRLCRSACTGVATLQYV